MPMTIIKNNQGTELEIQEGSHVAVDGSFSIGGSDSVDVFKEWGELDLGVRAEVVAIQKEAEGLVERMKGLLV